MAQESPTGVLASDQTESVTGRAMKTLRRIYQPLERVNFLVLPLLLIMLGLALATDKFFTANNLFNIMRTASVFMVIGVGQTFVITSANIDLSVGSMLALIAALAGTYLATGGSVIVAILMALALGIVFGALNGLIVTRLGVPALLATLGTLVAYRGIVQEYMQGDYHVSFPDPIVFIGQGMIGPVPVPVIIALSVAVIGSLLLRFTRFGRYCIAIGGNEDATRLAGINVNRWKTIVFAFQGLLVGLASIMLMGRLNAAHPSIGQGLELHVIAGVVLGGTSLFGGKGSIMGTVLGMLLIGVLENGLLLAGLGFFWQQIFLGMLIIFAVAVQTSRQRRAVRK
jgi:ribose transport system permease protein